MLLLVLRLLLPGHLRQGHPLLLVLLLVWLQVLLLLLLLSPRQLLLLLQRLLVLTKHMTLPCSRSPCLRTGHPTRLLACCDRTLLACCRCCSHINMLPLWLTGLLMWPLLLLLVLLLWMLRALGMRCVPRMLLLLLLLSCSTSAACCLALLGDRCCQKVCCCGNVDITGRGVACGWLVHSSYTAAACWPVFFVRSAVESECLKAVIWLLRLGGPKLSSYMLLCLLPLCSCCALHTLPASPKTDNFD
jgi:hypothetical protein